MIDAKLIEQKLEAYRSSWDSSTNEWTAIYNIINQSDKIKSWLINAINTHTDEMAKSIWNVAKTKELIVLSYMDLFISGIMIGRSLQESDELEKLYRG